MVFSATHLKKSGNIKKENLFSGFYMSDSFESFGEDEEKIFEKELLSLLKKACKNLQGYSLVVHYQPCDILLKALRNASIELNRIHLPNKTVMTINNEKVEVSQNNENFYEIK